MVMVVVVGSDGGDVSINRVYRNRVQQSTILVVYKKQMFIASTTCTWTHSAGCYESVLFVCIRRSYEQDSWSNIRLEIHPNMGGEFCSAKRGSMKNHVTGWRGFRIHLLYKRGATPSFSTRCNKLLPKLCHIAADASERQTPRATLHVPPLGCRLPFRRVCR